MKTNGDAIFGTRPFTVFGEGPTKAAKNATEKNSDIQSYTPEDIRFTTSPDGRTLYAIELGWPASGELVVHTLFRANPYLPAPICDVHLLGSSNALSFRQLPDGLHIVLPVGNPPGDIADVFRISTRCALSARR